MDILILKVYTIQYKNSNKINKCLNLTVIYYGGFMSRFADETEEKKKNIKFKYIAIGVLGVTLIGGSAFAYLNREMLSNMFKPKNNEEKVETLDEVKDAKKLKIYDEKSKTRPIAVMLDNNKFAWPHSGINSAYMIYEMEVEGRRKQAYGII